MKYTITTSKGDFEIVNESYYPIHYYISKLGNVFFKLSEITEEEASEIVEEQFGIMLVPLHFINYNLNETGYSAIESLHSLLESQGIEITENTYIFKL